MSIFILIFFLVLAAYGLLIDFYRRWWNRLPEFRGACRGETSVSVVVAVRNEERNIEELLEVLYAQDYPRELYEVVVVDDHSSDTTWKLLEEISLEGFRIRKFRLGEGLMHKKNALTAGIAAAEGELIISTDADCRMGGSWISSMVAYYEATDAQFIAAPVQMAANGSLAGIFQALDFLTMQGITGAAVSKQYHTICNGANLAYTRKAFHDVNGFEGIDHIPSGDDMLLMQKIAGRYPSKVLYLKSREAIVTTFPEKTWKDFFVQRIRWASKSAHYRDKTLVNVLVLTYLVNLCFALAVVGAVFYSQLFGFILLFLVAKVLVEFPFVNAVAGFFGQRRLMKYFIWLQPLHILYILVSGWLGRFGSYTWKNRKISNLGYDKK